MLLILTESHCEAFLRELPLLRLQCVLLYNTLLENRNTAVLRDITWRKAIAVRGRLLQSPFWLFAGLLIAVAPRYRYCSGATFTVAVAVAPLLLAESSTDSNAAPFLAAF